MAEDTYKTICEPCNTVLRERSSKFLSYAYPVETEEQIKEHLATLRKKYYDATHHCYAWRLGFRGEHSRANDDGEPSSTAGKPILGQLLSFDVTNCLIVVIRYFGGTKLGVAGLIETYRESAAQVLSESQIEQRTIDRVFRVEFSYMAMNSVMKLVKEIEPRIIAQQFDNLCVMELAIREGDAELFLSKGGKIEGAIINEL
ncbi:MAG: YigZ family protein [Rikenellaceae bacterium]